MTRRGNSTFGFSLQAIAAAVVALSTLACGINDAPCSTCAQPPPWEPPKPDASVDVSTDVSASDVTTGDVAEPEAPEEASVLPPLPPSCPDDMVPIPGGCMDVYEASREDATEDSQGEGTVATSREGVLPWQPVNLGTARAACDAAGKRLCRLDEWVWSCHGPDKTVYGYGNTYDPLICNGIDTFCNCDGSCAAAATCPYPRCFNMPSEEDPSIGPCGASFRVMPTGAFPDCKNEYGVFDINGNVWELADSDDGEEHFRGGAYNCADSPSLHRCDHDGTWGPTARGFRCCKDGS